MPIALLSSPVEDGVGLHHVIHHVGLGNLLGAERLAREGGQGRGDGWWCTVDRTRLGMWLTPLGLPPSPLEAA